MFLVPNKIPLSPKSSVSIFAIQVYCVSPKRFKKKLKSWESEIAIYFFNADVL